MLQIQLRKVLRQLKVLEAPHLKLYLGKILVSSTGCEALCNVDNITHLHIFIEPVVRLSDVCSMLQIQLRKCNVNIYIYIY